jgi:PIN domain nuclease of toxin-antitoxin system
LDTHAWIERALGQPLPPLVVETLTRHANTLALADISLWEAAKLVELGRLQLSIPLAEFFRLATL